VAGVRKIFTLKLKKQNIVVNALHTFVENVLAYAMKILLKECTTSSNHLLVRRKPRGIKIFNELKGEIEMNTFESS